MKEEKEEEDDDEEEEEEKEEEEEEVEEEEEKGWRKRYTNTKEVIFPICEDFCCLFCCLYIVGETFKLPWPDKHYGPSMSPRFKVLKRFSGSQPSI